MEKYPNLHTYLVAELGLHPRSGGLCRVWKDGARKPYMGEPAQLTARKRVSVMEASISFLSSSGSRRGREAPGRNEEGGAGEDATATVSADPDPGDTSRPGNLGGDH